MRKAHKAPMDGGSVMPVLVMSEDAYFFQKIRLELSGVADVVPYSDGQRNGAYAVICDTDTVICPNDGSVITASRRGGADISLPFERGSLVRRLFGGTEREERRITADDKDHSVLLFGRRIRLTDVEYALFSALYGRCGEFVSRDELLRTVWGGERDGGVVNVYIHYLREKLETDGEKIIISSRKLGYAIDKKYMGGAENA